MTVKHQTPICLKSKAGAQGSTKYICCTSVSIHLLKARESFWDRCFREEMCWRLRQAVDVSHLLVLGMRWKRDDTPLKFSRDNVFKNSREIMKE